VPLLGGINTNKEETLALSSFVNGLNVVINIIPWNPIEGLEFQGKPILEPGKKEIQNFVHLLEDQKLKVTKRLGKGRSCSGACGQLGVT